MNLTYEDVVWFSKTFGLFYLIGFSAIVLAYVYWPSNKKEFDQAATSIFHGDDKPCP